MPNRGLLCLQQAASSVSSYGRDACWLCYRSWCQCRISCTSLYRPYAHQKKVLKSVFVQNERSHSLEGCNSGKINKGDGEGREETEEGE